MTEDLRWRAACRPARPMACPAMFDMWRKPRFVSDTLSSISVMACRASDWLSVFDDEVPAAEQERVRDSVGDRTISSSQQALERFADDNFVVDEIAFRSQFRIDRALEAEPRDLATVNWDLEHIERLRRRRAETRQSIVALTTGIGPPASASQSESWSP